MIDPTKLPSLLKRLEWHVVTDLWDSTTECPICEWPHPNHSEDCELSTLIASLEAEEKPIN